VGVPTLSSNVVDSRDGANTLVAGGRAALCRMSPDAELHPD
jgi:hypothetical protein